VGNRISLFVLVLTFLLVQGAKSQVLQTFAPFSTGTPFLEPDGRREAVKISDTEFVTLTKVKGSNSGPSDFVLEKYDLTLKTSFKIPLITDVNEDYKDLYFDGNDIVLLSVIHNMDQKVSKLMAYGFDRTSGAKTWEKVLDNFKVTPWVAIKYKGSSKQTFENAIGSCLPQNFVTPLQYQYEVKFSPDSNKILTYIFDYGQKNLMAKVKVFDKKYNVIDTVQISIDNNFINYGIFPNNKGELFILNIDRMGRIVIIKYTIKTKAVQLLDMQYASSHRESLKLHVFSDDEVYLANINTGNGKLVGVMYSKFNFSTNLVEKINYHEISESLRQTITTMRATNKSMKGDENWLNYEITDFIVNRYEKIIIVLEKREFSSPGFLYDPTAVNDVENWQEREGRLNTEGLIMFSFNANDEIMWENYYAKLQSIDLVAGLISTSFVFDNSMENELRIVYASSDNATGIFNLINVVEYDELSGNKIKDIPLQNDEKLTFLRQYTLWWGDRLVLVGKKGMLGKKSSINLYKI
jgi:hypothetical protein